MSVICEYVAVRCLGHYCINVGQTVSLEQTECADELLLHLAAGQRTVQRLVIQEGNYNIIRLLYTPISTIFYAVSWVKADGVFLKLSAVVVTGVSDDVPSFGEVNHLYMSENKFVLTCLT